VVTTEKTADSEGSTWFGFMLDEAERVGNKLHEKLDPQLFVLFMLGGMLPNASARLNAELGAQQDRADHAVFVLNSRITTGCVSTYILAMRGLVTDAAGTLRNVVENVGLAIAIMRIPGVAERWQRGHQYRPGEVRNMIKAWVDLQPLYGLLSEYAHANASGQALYRTDTPSGSYQPRHVALTLLLLAQVELLYLREFHGRYHERLSIDAWPLLLDLGSKLNDALRVWAEALPDDWIELREHYATGKGLMPAPLLDPELSRQAREAFEQMRSAQQPPAPEREHD